MKDRIKEVRKENGMTQVVFAERIGIKQNSLAQIEMGKHNPSSPVIKAICREFHISQNWLEDGIEPKYIDQDESDIDVINRAMEGSSERKKELMRYIATMPDELVDAMFDHWEHRGKT